MSDADDAQLLTSLGFGIARSSLRAGVLEFQGYASLDRAAKPSLPAVGVYSDTLESIELADDQRYKDDPDGILGPQTRAALDAWKDAGLRCPVVIEAWKVGGAESCGHPMERRTCANENVWAWDDVKDPLLRLFARDYSGNFYPLTPGSPPERVAVGKYTPKLWGGPYTKAPAKPRVELVPSLVGLAAFPPPGTEDSNPPSDADRTASTYRVIRAVYERECNGYLDSLNAYDAGLVSAGGVHYTLSGGELAAYLAYATGRAPGLASYVVPWGLEPKTVWGTDGTALFDEKQRKYATPWKRPIPADEKHAYRSWHAFFRFQALTRAPELPPIDYDFARIRLRNLLATPFRSSDPVPKRSDGTAATLGEVFRSELSVACLLRWHVNVPGTLVQGGFVANGLGKRISEGPAVSKSVDALTGADETTLYNRLTAAARDVDDDPALTTDLEGAFAEIGRFPALKTLNPPVPVMCWRLLWSWGDDRVLQAKAFLSLGRKRAPGFLMHQKGL